jgi:hypothetical protein
LNAQIVHNVPLDMNIEDLLAVYHTDQAMRAIVSLLLLKYQWDKRWPTAKDDKGVDEWVDTGGRR